MKEELEKITKIYQENTNKIMKAHNLASEGTGNILSINKSVCPSLYLSIDFTKND